MCLVMTTWRYQYSRQLVETNPPVVFVVDDVGTEVFFRQTVMDGTHGDEYLDDVSTTD